MNHAESGYHAVYLVILMGAFRRCRCRDGLWADERMRSVQCYREGSVILNATPLQAQAHARDSSSRGRNSGQAVHVTACPSTVSQCRGIRQAVQTEFCFCLGTLIGLTDYLQTSNGFLSMSLFEVQHARGTVNLRQRSATGER